MGKNIIRGPEVREQAYSIMLNGGTYEDAINATGFTRSYIRQICAKRGLHFKNKPGSKPNQDLLKIRNRAVYLYLTGERVSDIAVSLGYSVTWVRSALKKANAHKYRPTKVVVNEFRICQNCGIVFYCDSRTNQCFCSKKCRSEHGHKKHDPVRRIRKSNAIVDFDITLEAVATRDNNICYLCGESVDWDNYKIIKGKKCALSKYPSIDHVVPLMNGGKHSWGNVRLAHIGCNSAKGVGEAG